MNARESLAADRDAEDLYLRARDELVSENAPEYQIATALVAIAAELRAARVYANYLEGRDPERLKRKQEIEEEEALRAGRN